MLARATEYVEALHAQLSGVVMEERYRQRASSPGFGRLGADSYERVTLRSAADAGRGSGARADVPAARARR